MAADSGVHLISYTEIWMAKGCEGGRISITGVESVHLRDRP